MLKLTRLNKQTVVVNPDHIHAADATPDTTLRMSSGECLIVRETLDELIDQVVAFRRRVRHPFGASPTDGDASGVAPVTERHGHDASEISGKEGGR
ncbi:hypothetical protein AKJ09_01339 [Labilithrix luteola]|uniref:Flagellar protein FlbD n=1 Tax=Labilithrix luteola TaxID=1391654 RepID=A0A0K1PMC0_9BACT|nr:flagellar FlbD family protein [Labilithrix luteola]AKU94675.1 hypothetical protein AKJ09_01339 [Labilithrix luteola]